GERLGTRLRSVCGRRGVEPPAGPPASEHREQGEKGASVMARAFNDCKVLVVEDNPTCQRFLEVCLHSIGFDVSVASDGEQALAILVANSFDLVLLDVQLPRVNGIEVAR